MKKFMVVVAAICLFGSTAYAADYCDTKYTELINRLKNTTKIMDQQKQKYLPSLKKALELCKENNMEEARKIMDELKDRFLHDALFDQRAFFGN